MQGKELAGEAEGILGLKQAWPSTIRTVKGDHKRFEETYFSAFPVRLRLMLLSCLEELSAGRFQMGTICSIMCSPKVWDLVSAAWC